MTVQLALLFLYLNSLSSFKSLNQYLNCVFLFSEMIFFPSAIFVIADIVCRCMSHKKQLGTCYFLLFRTAALYALLAYSQHTNDKNTADKNSDDMNKVNNAKKN